MCGLRIRLLCKWQACITNLKNFLWALEESLSGDKCRALGKEKKEQRIDIKQFCSSMKSLSSTGKNKRLHRERGSDNEVYTRSISITEVKTVEEMKENGGWWGWGWDGRKIYYW